MPELSRQLRAADDASLAVAATEALIQAGGPEAADALVTDLGRLAAGVPNPFRAPSDDRPASPSSPRGGLIGALSAAGPVVAPLLLRTLKSADERTRHGAAESLAGMAAGEVVPLLLDALADPQAERATVAFVLGRMGPPAAKVRPAAVVRDLAALLADGSGEVRGMAAYGLGSVGRDGGDQTLPIPAPAMASLRRQANYDPDHGAALRAGWAVWRITGEAGPARASALAALCLPGVEIRGRSWPDPLTVLAVSLLREGGPAALPILDEAVEDRAARARVLDVLDPPAPWAVNVLADVVRSRVPRAERRRAAALLGRLGPDAAPAVPALVDLLRTALRDRDLTTKHYCAEAIGKIGPAAVDAVPALCDLANDSAAGTSPVATTAMQSLGRLGPAAGMAVPVLTARLAGPTDQARDAADALAAIGPAAADAIPALLRAANAAADPGPFRQAARAISPWRAAFWALAVPVLDPGYLAATVLTLAALTPGARGHYRRQLARRLPPESIYFPKP